MPEHLWTPVGEATVTGPGCGPDGEVATEPATDLAAAADLLAGAALCRDASLEASTPETTHWTAAWPRSCGGSAS